MVRPLAAPILAVALASFAVARGVVAQTAGTDPFLGAWRLNVERSVYRPGPRPPADLVDLRAYTMLEGGWMRYTTTSTNPQGAPTMQVGVFKVDGQRHPVHNFNTIGALMATGRASNLTRSYRAIDARTVESITYTDGVAGLPVVRTVSADGMTIIQTSRGTNAQGVTINDVLVYDRIR
jgi:hypothetical protein